MKITLEQLRAEKACPDQLAKFQELFGNSVEVTQELCIRHASDFDFGWAARHLLRASAWAECERVRAPAYAEYERATAGAFFDASQMEG